MTSIDKKTGGLSKLIVALMLLMSTHGYYYPPPGGYGSYPSNSPTTNTYYAYPTTSTRGGAPPGYTYANNYPISYPGQGTPSNHPVVQPPNYPVVQPPGYPPYQPQNHPPYQPQNYPPVKPQNPYKNEGCFHDTRSRVMPYAKKNLNPNGPTQCLKHCNSNKYQYAGLENGEECWCSNYLPSTSKRNNCSKACRGNTPQTCGGWGSIDVYSGNDYTAKKFNNIGCYHDTRNRVMPNAMRKLNPNGVRPCLDHCNGKGYKYAGLENGEECWCSNNVPTSSSRSNCHKKCRGNTSQTCGGWGSIDVYEYQSSGYSRAFKSVKETLLRKQEKALDLYLLEDDD